MALVNKRINHKHYLLNSNKWGLATVKKYTTYILILSSLVLLYFSQHLFLANTALTTSSTILSIGHLIYKESKIKIENTYNNIINLQNIKAENIMLKLKIDLLKQEYNNMMLIKHENIALKKVLNVVKSINNNYITSKIISFSSTPFSSSIIINSGKNNGISINNIVYGNQGLIGRIIQTTDEYSVVMLINDYNSRIPAITNKSREKGIIAKQGDELKLIYLAENHKIKVGELIYTSGDGLLFPYGILVAKVSKINDQGVFLTTINDINNLDFVVVELSHEINHPR